MDRFDREILEFVLNWAPYGGPPAGDALPLFGLTDRQLGDRIRCIIVHSLAGRLSPDDRDLLLRVLGALSVSEDEMGTWCRGTLPLAQHRTVSFRPQFAV